MLHCVACRCLVQLKYILVWYTIVHSCLDKEKALAFTTLWEVQFMDMYGEQCWGAGQDEVKLGAVVIIGGD